MLQRPPSGADEVISALSWQLVTAIIHNEEGDGLTLLSHSHKVMTVLPIIFLGGCFSPISLNMSNVFPV
jgi:hypothetical protein